jgi:hypothetical protein
MVSQKFLRCIRTTGKPIYQLAHQAGVRPGCLYKITSGIDRPKFGDKRVVKVGGVLGLEPSECFDKEGGK